MRLFLLLLSLLLGGCASSSIVGTRAFPATYRPLEVGRVPALDSVNAALEAGRFTLVTTDGREVRGIRGVAVGLQITRFQLPTEHVGLRPIQGGDVTTAFYLPTGQIDYIATERSGGMQTGAWIGATPGLVVAGASLAIAIAASSDCADDLTDQCFGRDLLVYFGVGGGLMAAALGGMLGVGVGHMAAPARPATTLYQGPVTRYLTGPSRDR